MQKSHLRKHIVEILRGLSQSEKADQSRVVFKKIIEHPRYKAAQSLSVYLSTENEIDTQGIVEKALEVDGKQCFIPLVRKRSEQYCGDEETRMIMVNLGSMREYESLPVNNYGIKEPLNEKSSVTGDAVESSDFGRRARVEEGQLDLVIVPGVAFARDGQRLGHGKGYYDEFLAHWSKRSPKRPYTIGLAFKEQIVEDMLSVEGHDFRLDEILTSD